MGNFSEKVPKKENESKKISVDYMGIFFLGVNLFTSQTRTPPCG